MDNGLSMSDVLALQKDGGMGNNGMGWMFMFFLFIFAFGGFGGGRWNNGGAMQTLNTDVQYTNLMNSLGSLGNGISRGFDNISTTLGQGFTQTTNQNFTIQKDIDRAIYNNTVGQAGLSRELCGLSGTIRDGFCETNRNIDANRYEMQKLGCDIITNANYNTRDLTATIWRGNQDILNKMDAMETNRLREQINNEKFEKSQLQNQLSNMAQSAHIINTLAPSPIPAYVVCPPHHHGHHYPIAQFS